MIIQAKEASFSVPMDTITLDSFFDSAEIESDYLRNLLEKVLEIINRPDLYFGKIGECRIFGSAGVVTRDGDIFLDSKKLNFYGDDVAMAITAHELAHYHLGHYIDWEFSEEKEIEADELAKSWGFNIDKFRKEFSLDGKEN